MKAWRVSGAVVLLLVAVPAGWGQSCNLAEMVKPGDCFRYDLDMKLKGEIRFRQEEKTVPVKLSASASHAYPERVLEASGAMVQKSVRIYETAKANIQRGEQKTESTLRAGRNFVVAQRHKEERLVYCPAGALYRTEIELLADHFDTLAVAGVLPGKAVKVGETWKLPNSVAQALCSLEGMTENKLTGKLDKLAGDTASFSVSGSAAGVENGAVVKMTVEATGTFDVKAPVEAKGRARPGAGQPGEHGRNDCRDEAQGDRPAEDARRRGAHAGAQGLRAALGDDACRVSRCERAVCTAAHSRLAADGGDGRARGIALDGPRRLRGAGEHHPLGQGEERRASVGYRCRGS
jgi:hypothetical protein